MQPTENYPIRMRASVHGDTAVVKALLTHPMENGFTRAGDAPQAAHFITELRLRHNDRVVAELATGSGIAANPLFGWRIRGVRAGDTISLSWLDNQGRQQTFATTAQ